MPNWNKIQNPEIFQGNKQKKSYFEGWYFKMVDEEGSNIYAVIPGIALDRKKGTSHSFIQFFDGKKGEYIYFTYDVNAFHASEDKFKVRIENNYFSPTNIRLDIEQEGYNIKGDIRLSNLVPLKKTLLSPGIMGILSYLPMQTKHGIVSMMHNVGGRLSVNNRETVFREGSRGYIEKDWGSSFPSAWIWMHSNHFTEPRLAFTFSVAIIPFLGLKFKGFFCVIWYKNKFYRFASYTQAKLRKIDVNKNKVYIIGENRKYLFEIKAIQAEVTDMKAPSLGEMRAHCFESMKSRIHLRLIEKKDNTTIFEDIGKYAGLEIMDNDKLQI